jgi:hypothetical protein
MTLTLRIYVERIKGGQNPLQSREDGRAVVTVADLISHRPRALVISEAVAELRPRQVVELRSAASGKFLGVFEVLPNLDKKLRAWSAVAAS